MDTLGKKLSRSALVFAAAAVALILAPKDWLRRMALMLRWLRETHFGVGRVLFARHGELLLFFLFLLLMLAGIVAATRCVALFLRMARMSAAPGASAREQHLRRLDGQLRSGLIDRDEYKALRRKYLNMEFPDDRT